MAEIKTDENASEASDQDQTASVSSITCNARDVVKPRRSIQDPKDMT